MAKVDLFDNGDLLHFAVTLGYNWNQAIDILREDGVGNFDDGRNETHEWGDFPTEEERGVWGNEVSDDTRKIMRGFMEHHKINSFKLEP